MSQTPTTATNDDSMGGVSDLGTGNTDDQAEESLRDLFDNQIFLTQTQQSVLGQDALSSKTLLGLYFSASWCPPCRQFTPLLAEVHRELIQRKAPFQVIYVPFDKTQVDMVKYIQEQHGDWLAIPLNDSSIQQLCKKFKVSCVPKLLIVSMDGQVVSSKGRKEVEDRGIIAYRSWMSSSNTKLGAASILDDIPTKVTVPRGDGSVGFNLPSDPSRSEVSTMGQAFTSQEGLSDYSASEAEVGSDAGNSLL